MSDHCFECGGALVEKTTTFDITPSYMSGVQFSYEGKYSQCQLCGADPVLYEQAKFNDREHEQARFKAMRNHITELERRLEAVENCQSLRADCFDPEVSVVARCVLDAALKAGEGE